MQTRSSSSTDTSAKPRYDAPALVEFAASLLSSARMPADRARDVAEILVEADLLGHDTHGLHLLATYLQHIEAGHMKLEGEPITLSDHGAVIAWNGQRLPGPWLVLRAMEIATERAKKYGSGTVTIGRSHHIACLAAYLKRATDQGLVMLLLTSAPAGASVAPHGGTRAVFSPSPIAIGFPTGDAPVLVDVSTSITTNMYTGRLRKEGKHLPHHWLIDENGEASDDPAVLLAPNKGTILPLGGLDAGHKGYGLALLVEALTAGLAGHGRADPREPLGGSVFVQILDPQAFAGGDAFRRQMDWVAQACLDNPPRPGVDQVRLPGQKGLLRRERQLREGVAMEPSILPALAPWAEKFGVAVPASV
ncbi:MAG: Ldh family oxidoreductase [Burkholderiales bacterium]|nr:Ldh family oxidoreductase [Burkholderiales bacterium]